MRQFTLVGLVLLLLAGTASAQGVVHVTTFGNGRAKSTIIEQVPGPPLARNLDQLQEMPPHPPKGLCGPPNCVSPLACYLADQPALLHQLGKLDAAMAGYVAAVRIGIEELPRPNLLDEKRTVVQKPEEKKPEPLKKIDERLVPAPMLTLELKEWDEPGRAFVETNGRRWCLLKGCPLPEKALRLRGWLLESDGKKLYFLDYFGNLWANVAGPLP
jgi:hypothetical protein